MTFTELKTKVKDYCNLSSIDADTRVGIAINNCYRRITSSLGLDTARFVTRSAAMTLGQQYVTFTSIEKIDRVLDATDSSNVRLLKETSVHQIRSTQPGASSPTQWAERNTTATSVTILTDTVPQDAWSLQADGWTTLSDLTGTDEPVFAESYHDVLAWYVISEELLKKEKAQLAETYRIKADALLAELRFHIADSHTHDTPQGGGTVGPVGLGSGGGASNQGGTSYTQTGLLTFDRGAGIAPFAVTETDAATVANLDADKVDGMHAACIILALQVFG